MLWSELNLENAPKSGWVLGYTSGSPVVFEQYNNLENVKSFFNRDKNETDINETDINETDINETDILEIHLFDQQKEYRAISTRSKRFPNGIIETVADFPEDDSSEESKLQYYKEKILLDDKKGVITVLNHISYDISSKDGRKPTGMATVDNYRLVMEDE